MKTLHELTKLVSRNKALVDTLIPTHKDSQLIKLYELTFSEKKYSDKEAMAIIYGRQNKAAFSRLKTRMRDLLIKALIFQGTGTSSQEPWVEEGVTSFRNTLVSRILLERRSYQLATEILERSIIMAMRYHVTEAILNQSRMLSMYYGSINYNKYKYLKYYEIQKKYMDVYHWEVRAENNFIELQRIQLQSLANMSKATKEKAKLFVTELQSVNHIRSYNFNYNKYRVEAAYYEFNKDYTALLQLCEKASIEFSQPDLRRSYAISSIRLRRIWALIQAAHYAEAVKLGMEGMNKEGSGTINWFYVSHYTIKAMLYHGDYSLANKTILQVLYNPKFENLSDGLKEIFNTTYGYINLLHEAGIVTADNTSSENLPDFKLGKFLNTVPVFSKDKQGINVSILMLHIAYLLLRKDFDTIIDRIDSLKQYAYRYLRKDDSFRSNCMIKMVIQMARADFNPIRTERYTIELRRQLSEVNLAGSGENIEVEFIPFEVLWDTMVNALAK